MTKISDIWNELEKDTSSSTGLLLRRYAAAVLPDVFVAFRKAEGQRALALLMQKESNVNLSRYAQFKDIKLEIVPDERDTSKSFLLILLINKQHADVFATLCEDLISGIMDVKDDVQLVSELLNRLEKWKSLFDKASIDGLSPEEQRGLYGELYFLRKCITSSVDYQKTILLWVGPENAVRDFQLSDWALEVKTTHGNNHQKIQISSERQLDNKNLNSLILFHLSLEVQQKNGESLNELCNEIIALLESDIASQSQFRMKLLLAGYFNHHRHLYESIGYQTRNEHFYLVKNEFPRIEEKDIRKGVGDVKYSIILSDYKDYIMEEANVLEMIN